ncbi:hypothetical protein KJ765_03735 [Candidatus Micrarchaeota archaeon]|nr:hypothetical protein [Candidatus Micrarchaeota archaeon]
MRSRKAQASFFDGILFLMVVVFSVAMIFVTLNSYTVSQDRALRSAYFMNYLQSTAKALYFIDVNTLGDVETYCADLGGANSERYCKTLASNNDRFDRFTLSDGSSIDTFDCPSLTDYSNLITVADLLKKDVSPIVGGIILDESFTTDSATGTFLDDHYGHSNQRGRTALRCSMKEIMKPFTFSGYHYMSEVTRSTEIAGAAILDVAIPPAYIANDLGYASDFMYLYRPGEGTGLEYAPFLETGSGPPLEAFDCAKIDSNQLLVLRSPFKIIVGALDSSNSRNPRGGFESLNLVLRLCLWPSE